MRFQDTASYRGLFRIARRFTRSEDEARDLVQDALLVALDSGVRDWSAQKHQPWLAGVVRKRAAFLARTASRRRNREQNTSLDASTTQPWRWHPTFLHSLPPSLRAVATLASADLNGAEIRWLLRLSPTALRSRLSALRRAAQARGESPTITTALMDVALGKRRKALLTTLKRSSDQVLATHDADGHAILFRKVPHKSDRGGNYIRKDSSHAYD